MYFVIKNGYSVRVILSKVILDETGFYQSVSGGL